MANRPSHLSRRSDADRGAALITVLWISLGLTTLALYFGQAMVLEYRLAANTTASLETSHTIDGAQRYVKHVLAALEEPGLTPDIEDYEAEEAPVGDGRFWLVGRPETEGLATETPTWGLAHEAAKSNLNTATREMLVALPDMTEQLAAAIIDWRDSDTELSPDGAESATYLAREPAYICKDGMFETIAELRLLSGADEDILYGEDTNHNGILDPWEDDGDASSPDDNADGRLDAGVVEYLTIYSREPNQRPEGGQRIDTTDDEGLAELAELLREEFGDERAQSIEQAAGISSNDLVLPIR